MIRIALLAIALFGIGTLARASTVSPLDGVIRAAHIIEAKTCKAGFTLSKRGRCVAIPQPPKPDDENDPRGNDSRATDSRGSTGGSSGGGSSGGGSFY